jgi:WD40 repeat protein
LKIILNHTNILSGHRGAIYKLFSDTNDENLWSAGGDGFIVRWTPSVSADGKLLAQDSDKLLSAIISSDGRIFAGTLEGNLIELSYNSNEESKKWVAHRKGVYCILEENRKLYTCGGDGRITLWGLGNMTPTIQSVKVDSKLRCLAFNAETNIIYAGSSSGNIYAYDADNLESINNVFRAHNRAIFSLKIHKGVLYTGGMDAHIRVWHPVDLKCLYSIPAHWFTVNDLAIHPILPIIASGSRDKSIRLWSLPEMELLLTIKSHHHSVNSLLWIQHGNLLASAGDDKSIMLHHFIYNLKD